MSATNANGSDTRERMMRTLYKLIVLTRDHLGSVNNKRETSSKTLYPCMWHMTVLRAVSSYLCVRAKNGTSLREYSEPINLFQVSSPRCLLDSLFRERFIPRESCAWCASHHRLLNVNTNTWIHAYMYRIAYQYQEIIGTIIASEPLPLSLAPPSFSFNVSSALLLLL